MNYDDIIEMEYPLKSSDRVKHPRMTIENRAKIFAPFAALKGHEEAIAAKRRIVVPRRIIRRGERISGLAAGKDREDAG